jgi:hypothetical protein
MHAQLINAVVVDLARPMLRSICEDGLAGLA